MHNTKRIFANGVEKMTTTKRGAWTGMDNAAGSEVFIALFGLFLKYNIFVYYLAVCRSGSYRCAVRNLTSKLPCSKSKHFWEPHGLPERLSLIVCDSLVAVVNAWTSCSGEWSLDLKSLWSDPLIFIWRACGCIRMVLDCDVENGCDGVLDWLYFCSVLKCIYAPEEELFIGLTKAQVVLYIISSCIFLLCNERSQVH